MLSIVCSLGRIAAVSCALSMALVGPVAAQRTLPTPGLQKWSCKGLGECSIGSVTAHGSCRLTVRGTGKALVEVLTGSGGRLIRVSFSGDGGAVLLPRVVGSIRVRIYAAARVPVEGELSCGG